MHWLFPLEVHIIPVMPLATAAFQVKMHTLQQCNNLFKMVDPARFFQGGVARATKYKTN